MTRFRSLDRRALDRRAFLSGSGAGLGLAAFGSRLPETLAATPAAGGRQTAQDIPFRIYRITFRGRTAVEDGFDDYMTSNNIPVDFLTVDVDQDPSRLPPHVERIKALKPDLVLTWGTPVTLGVAGRYDAADKSRYATEVPIVFSLVSAPVQSGIVPSREKPGRNVTGVVHVVPTETQLRAMAAYRPFRTLGVLYTPREQNSLAILRDLRLLQQTMGFRLVERQFPIGADGRPKGDGVEDLLAGIKAAGADWLYLLPDTFLGTNYDRIAPVTRALRLPSFGAAELALSKGGAVLGLVSRYFSVGQLAAYKASQILLEGKHPSEIPVETLKRFSLIINMPVARALDFFPPIRLLSYAEFIDG